MDNDMQNSSTAMSLEVVLGDDNSEHLNPNMEVLRQLGQSMEFGKLNDDDDDWSQSDDDKNNKNDRRINLNHSSHHTSKSIEQRLEKFSSVQKLWKVRFLYLVRLLSQF